MLDPLGAGGQLLALVLLLAGLVALSHFLRLGQARAVVWASVRMVVQLGLIGAVLHGIFEASHWGWMLLWATVATVAAAVSAASRISTRYRQLQGDLLIALVGGAWTVVGYGLFVVVRPDPWFSPQFLVPLLGLVLGNMLNGLSLGVSRFLRDCEDRRDEIETVLALGGTRWEAARPRIRESLHFAMIPILNAMSVAGLVSLPGMMTGQILAGAPVLEAVRYQVLIFVLILTATALGTGLALTLGYLRMLDSSHRLRADRLDVPR